MDLPSRIELYVHQLGGFKAPFLSFFAILLSLLVAPSPVALLGSSSNYVPLVASFLDEIRDGFLPSGWHPVIVNPSEPLEIYAFASVVIALLLSSPVIAYQVMKFIVSYRGTRGVTYLLTAAASLLFVSGALFGCFFAHYVFDVLTPLYPDVVSSPPVINTASFYFVVLGVISGAAIGFSLPAYVYALIRFRR